MQRRWDETTGVVTPEAVSLQFHEANVGSRGVALFFDAIVLVLVLSVVNTAIGFLFAQEVAVPGWVALSVLLVVNFLFLFGYPIAFETLTRGQTLGKMIMGLRVVTVEGAPITFRHAAIRAALWLVDFGLTAGMAAVFATLLSNRHQRLGDMVAGTVVLRERSGTQPPAASVFTVPPGAESYAQTIDPSGLTARDYEAVRGLLLRARTLPDDVRADLGRRLARAMAAKLNHVPPPTVRPELFLSCLAARYQEQRAGLKPPPSSATPGTAAEQAPATAQTPPGESDESAQWGDFTPPR